VRDEWQPKKLGDVATLQRGFDLPTQHRKSGDVPLVTSSGISDTHDKSAVRGPGVATGRSGSIGSVFFIKDDFWPLNTVLYVKDFHGNDPRFVYHLLKHFDLKRFASGTGVPTLNRNFVHDELVNVPPLREQQRIAAILDEAFEGIATAKAHAEKNLQNARAIFESHLQSIFHQRGKGWLERPFEDLIESNVIGLTKNSREQGEDKAWPYVKMNNITRDNRFDFSSFTCVDATNEEVSKFSLRNGDFLFNTRNSYELVGKSCIYESDSNETVLFNNNIMRVRFKSGADSRFILFAFLTKAVVDELRVLKSGTTNVSAIYFKNLKSLVIPVPPIATQKTIVGTLDALSEETQRLVHVYEGKLAALNALKKSLLHRAFAGELTVSKTVGLIEAVA
jgi:type I restriction enzyme, S subunit